MRRWRRPRRGSGTGCRTAATITSSASARSTEINDANVDKLGLAWQFETATERGLEATPLVVDGVMYTTGSWSVTYAIDARTGKQLWKYDPEVHRKYDNLACCDVVNRGAAFYKGKVYVGVLDGRLVALDAKSGKVAWQTTTVDQTQPYTITGAPRIAKGKVIIGNGGAEYGVRGYVSAYDAETGKLAWRFYTVPGDPSKPQENKALETALPTWKGDDWWKYGGGGTVWDSIVYDPELNLLYVGTGNGSPWNRDLRSPGGGDNLYLALDPRDQSRQRRAGVALPDDAGRHVGLHRGAADDAGGSDDRRPPAQGDHAGAEERVLLRARSRHRRAARGGSVRRGELGDARRPEDRTAGRDSRRRLQGQGHLHPPGSARRPQLAGDVVQPEDRAGLHSGAGQRPLLRAADRTCHVHAATRYNLGARRRSAATSIATTFRYKGRLLAWDPVARKPRWTVEYGNYWNGGTLATAGNLVFQGTAAGDFIAYRATDGAKLWSSWATHRHRRAADHLRDRRQAVRVGDGGLGRRVLEEGAQLRTAADVRDRRHGVAADAAARRARVTAIAQQRRRRSRSPPARRSSPPTARAATAARRFFPTCADRRPACYTGLEKILDGVAGRARHAALRGARQGRGRGAARLSARRTPEAGG